MSYKILFVDNNPALRLIAEKKLSQEGYEVFTAETGKQGIRCVLEHSPDLLLLDYELPDKTGVDVCRYLRNHTMSIDKPILFMTGNNDFQSIENAFLAGATDFSSKPINWTLLIYRIQYMLRTHKLYLSLLSSKARLTKAQKIAKIANWDFSSLDKSLKWSDTLFDILELDKKQQEGFELQHFLDCIPNDEKETIRLAIESCCDNQLGFELEHALITSAGSTKIIHHMGNITKNDVNQTVDCIGTLQDITERRHTENRIRTLAYCDSLTGLMNRDAFLSTLNNILSNDKKHKLLSALFFIDLDDFKQVNDTLGHDFGDALLCKVAARIKQCVRTAEQDKSFKKGNSREITRPIFDSVFRPNSMNINRFGIGRLGGDEFTIFLVDIFNQDVAEKVAKRLLKALEKPFNLDGHDIYITFSIGIAISPNDGGNIQSLLKNADTAMYSAKSNGKNNFQFYIPSMSDCSTYRFTLEADFGNATNNNELSLVYQPQICIQTGRLIGAEALMRWKHKTRGDISPAEFIPLAEETGQILVLGNWLFDEFNKHLQSWKNQGLITKGFKLALNVSPLQLDQTNMDKIVTVFSDLELNKHVEFELTEMVLMSNVESNLDKMNRLVKQNITLSIDDFGTGYSSLSYLHRFPVNTIKINRSFISNMKNDGQISIVRAIIAMAHSMNIKVVAEGIENQWQLDYLKSEGCNYGQGFFLYKPMSIDNFQQLLQTHFTE